jgi:hypothetical protein
VARRAALVAGGPAPYLEELHQAPGEAHQQAPCALPAIPGFLLVTVFLVALLLLFLGAGLLLFLLIRVV